MEGHRMTTTETTYSAAYKLGSTWMAFPFPSRDEALDRITLWQTTHGFKHKYPTKLITKTKTITITEETDL